VTTNTGRGAAFDAARADCCIVGGGPGGAFLGLLLARAGVRVLLLEERRDLARQYRGETVQPPTLALLEDLGLLDRVLAHARARGEHWPGYAPGAPPVPLAGLAPGTRHPYVVNVPQEALLGILHAAIAAEPGGRVLLGARAQGLLEDGDRITGIRYRLAGVERTVAAPLSVAADGRHTRLRGLAGLAFDEADGGIDMLWFTLPRLADDPYRGGPRQANGRILQVLDRGDRWQCGYVVPRGGWAALRARGIPALRADLAALVPEFAARLATEPSLDRPAVLPGALGRAPRWWRPGFLLLGDAAHTMSPIGGVGILMAVADAVAAANVLVPAFDRGTVTPADLVAIQARRALPVALVQGLQALIGCRMSRPGLLVAGVAPGVAPPPSAEELALAEATAARLRRSGRAVARSFAFGVLPPRLAPALRARVARTVGDS